MTKRIARFALAPSFGVLVVGLSILLAVTIGNARGQARFGGSVKRNERASHMPYCDGCRFIVTLRAERGTFNANSKVLKATLKVGSQSQDWGIVPAQQANADGSELTVLLVAKVIPDSKSGGRGKLTVVTTDNGTDPTTSTEPPIEVELVNLDPCVGD